MMYPLALSSLVAVTIIVERLIMLRRSKIIIAEIIDVVEQFISYKDLGLAKKICSRYEGPLPNIIKLQLDNIELDKDDAKELIEDQGRQEVNRLGKGLGILETVASIAPLLGLAGTVLGMIKVFGVIKEQGVGQASALSGGISEALLTTVTGLFIGIPALVFYNYFSHKTEKYSLEIEKYTSALYRKINRLKSSEDLSDEAVNQYDIKTQGHEN
ncbi:MAG: MotA/TolQ/ExbB proton channel family protein [candidate division Zixibacteria bacterium]|nr:MotA/TolQ/ExbB proton channel family protein [candidate division Zixibacteria bacterium]